MVASNRDGWWGIAALIAAGWWVLKPKTVKEAEIGQREKIARKQRGLDTIPCEVCGKSATDIHHYCKEHTEFIDKKIKQEKLRPKQAKLDYENMSVGEIKERLKAKGLPLSGKKQEMIDRLKKHNEGFAGLGSLFGSDTISQREHKVRELKGLEPLVCDSCGKPATERHLACASPECGTIIRFIENPKSESVEVVNPWANYDELLSRQAETIMDCKSCGNRGLRAYYIEDMGWWIVCPKCGHREESDEASVMWELDPNWGTKNLPQPEIYGDIGWDAEIAILKNCEPLLRKEAEVIESRIGGGFYGEAFKYGDKVVKIVDMENKGNQNQADFFQEIYLMGKQGKPIPDSLVKIHHFNRGTMNQAMKDQLVGMSRKLGDKRVGHPIAFWVMENVPTLYGHTGKVDDEEDHAELRQLNDWAIANTGFQMSDLHGENLGVRSDGSLAVFDPHIDPADSPPTYGFIHIAEGIEPKVDKGVNPVGLTMAADWTMTKVNPSVGRFEEKDWRPWKWTKVREYTHAPKGYQVFIDREGSKYRAVVSPPEEQKVVNKIGSMTGYEHQIQGIKGMENAKAKALELMNQLVAAKRGGAAINVREQAIRQRLGMKGVVNDPVVFDVHQVGDKIVVNAKGRDFESHPFIEFKREVERGRNYGYFPALGKVNEKDHPELNTRRDFFKVMLLYYGRRRPHMGPSHASVGEIEELFEGLQKPDWMDDLSPLMQTILKNRESIPIDKRTNQWIPFSILNERYRHHGNRRNPSYLSIIKGNNVGIVKLRAKTTKGAVNKLKELNVCYHSSISEQEQAILEIYVDTHKRQYMNKSYGNSELKGLAIDLVAVLSTKSNLKKEFDRGGGHRLNAWDGNTWDNSPYWIDELNYDAFYQNSRLQSVWRRKVLSSYGL